MRSQSREKNICMLKKPLYELKQTPRNGIKSLMKSLLQMDL